MYSHVGVAKERLKSQRTVAKEMFDRVKGSRFAFMYPGLPVAVVHLAVTQLEDEVAICAGLCGPPITTT